MKKFLPVLLLGACLPLGQARAEGCHHRHHHLGTSFGPGTFSFRQAYRSYNRRSRRFGGVRNQYAQRLIRHRLHELRDSSRFFEHQCDGGHGLHLNRHEFDDDIVVLF